MKKASRLMPPFRRLKHKTQVFIAPADDHYVTRLTHTLEVSQISRTIARALNLNEDLTEAIALGHDLGHTPFGHIGEEVINELYQEGFRHNEQSLRVVDILENEGRGLNLTWEVRDGILKHSKSRIDVFGSGWELPATLEGQICKISDIVAYVNHDLNDAIRSGIITGEDLPAEAIEILGKPHSDRINTMVIDIIDNSWSATGSDLEKPGIMMSMKTVQATDILRQFLFDKVYDVCARTSEADEARLAIKKLYNYYIANPAVLPVEYNVLNSDIRRAIIDYVAGMTDQYAFKMAASI
ncbi:MAG: deoxyguanosinetriphosphate triphosphohydrolase [Chloroflexi bacterium]|nr:deoxyguanosinetriphosphate triphosphohydrolase [Chloroflexota bacterium]